jgi:hypothetical protein
MTSSVFERYWPKVAWAGPDECWEWTAARNWRGYGEFHLQGRTRIKAHRVAYELVIGPIPEGMQLDHICRDRGCVNPLHLEPVTNRENVLRGVGVTARNAVKTHCKRGHPFDDANTLIHPPTRGRGERRQCRACRPVYRGEPA